MHGRSREVKHVVSQMSDVDFFDYRLVVRSSGIQELNHGHSGLRQGLLHVESLCEELRAGNYGLAHSDLLRALQIFEESHNKIRHALAELGEYYDDHPTEVREINHGLTEMCDGCDCLVKALVSLRQTKTGESLEMGRRALTHLREAAHRIGSHLRDIKDCCPSNVEFEVMDIRENEARDNGAMEGAKPVEMVACHSTHAPGEPCNHAPGSQPKTEEKKPDDLTEPEEPNQEDVVAQLTEQLEDKHVPLDKVAEAVESVGDPSAVTEVPLMARDLKDESAMEELMRQVSENRARTIDRLVSDARAAKAEAIANTNYVPTPGEEVPGMKPMAVNTGPMMAAANVVDVQAKLSDAKKGKAETAEKGADSDRKADKSAKINDKSAKKQTGKVLEKALEKAKETARRTPRNAAKSDTAPAGIVRTEKKAKKEEEPAELTFDDSDLDFNKAGKKII